MKKCKPLHIKIPEPCNQVWTHMPVNGSGRYCNQCSKTVLDFSGMTDIELVNFFKTNSANVCGRFNTKQLNRDILLSKPKRSLPALYHKAAAAVLALMSFRLTIAQVQRKATSPTSLQSPTSRSVSQPDSVILTGRVTQNYSQPVVNAKVDFDGLLETYTDTEGRFHLQISKDLMGSHNLYFSATGLKRSVRNFHSMMGATEYNVNLDNPDDCTYRYNMGAPINSSEPHNFPSIAFTQSEVSLNSDDKLLLATVAEHMRIEPQLAIKLVAYGKGKVDTKKAKQKIEIVSNYLTKDQGIYKDRIKQQVERISGVKLVDILQDEK